MKVGILAGGVGSRISEETEIKPKPMVEIGGKPIIWHIMKHYENFGHTEFAVALGYKGDYIKRYMADFCSFNGNLSIDFAANKVVNVNGNGVRHDFEERINWKLDLVETGANTATGGRIKRLQPYMGSETFMVTWGDGVSNVDLDKLVAFHRNHGKLATVTAVRPPARFGKLSLDGEKVTRFSEKPQLEEGWINGAFFVLEPEIFDFIDGDETQFEKGPLETLARNGELMAYMHDGFWQCMDTLRDKKLLESYWDAGNAPWKTWSQSA